VLAADVLDELHELREFRHFFRNAYVLDFDPDLVRAHAERVGRVYTSVTATLTGFCRHVDDLLAKLGAD
jgi:hypothetical protein